MTEVVTTVLSWGTKTCVEVICCTEVGVGDVGGANVQNYNQLKEVITDFKT